MISRVADGSSCWRQLLRSFRCEAQDARHRRGRCDSPRAGRPKPSRKRAGFSSTPRSYWCTISTQERAALAPKNAQRPQEQLRELPRTVTDFPPERPLNLDRKIFHDCLRGSPSGVASGPRGCTNRCSVFASTTKKRCLCCSKLWKISPEHSCVSRIATGTAFRRLVAEIIVRQFSDDVEAACGPW